MISVARKRTNEAKAVRIQEARCVTPYKLRLRFDDGHRNVVDFGPFLRNSVHPSIRVYLDPERFKRFTIEDGVLHWNDFDLVFPMADLYEGRISGNGNSV